MLRLCGRRATSSENALDIEEFCDDGGDFGDEEEGEEDGSKGLEVSAE